MSMVRCDECDQIFSSDNDPDCFVEVGNMRRLHQTIVLCEACRDERDRQLELQAHYESQAMADAEAAEARS